MPFLQPKTLEALGAVQHTYPQEFTISAAANSVPTSVGSGPISIQGGIPFFSESVYITYPTCRSIASVLTDDGVCRLTLQLKTNSSVQLFDQPALLSLFAVPGRQAVEGAVATVAAAAVIPGAAPHIDGKEFHVYLPGGSNFVHTFSNTANVAATVQVMWHGWNLSGEFDTEDKFWKVVTRYQESPYGQ